MEASPRSIMQCLISSVVVIHQPVCSQVTWSSMCFYKQQKLLSQLSFVSQHWVRRALNDIQSTHTHMSISFLFFSHFNRSTGSQMRQPGNSCSFLLQHYGTDLRWSVECVAHCSTRFISSETLLIYNFQHLLSWKLWPSKTIYFCGLHSTSFDICRQLPRSPRWVLRLLSSAQ